MCNKSIEKLGTVSYLFVITDRRTDFIKRYNKIIGWLILVLSPPPFPLQLSRILLCYKVELLFKLLLLGYWKVLPTWRKDPIGQSKWQHKTNKQTRTYKCASGGIWVCDPSLWMVQNYPLTLLTAGSVWFIGSGITNASIWIIERYSIKLCI